MPWFKVDDGFHAHHKVAKLGPDHSDALSLWVVAGSWSADQLTDGWVPEYVAARLDVHYAERAKALVRVGLWEIAERDGEPGWLFHGWSEPGRNPTSDQVKAEREATAERQRRFRDKVKGAKQDPSGGNGTTMEAPKEAPESNAVTNAVSHGPVTAPVPFLSVPFHSIEENPSSPATASPPGKSVTRKRGTPKDEEHPRFGEFWNAYPLKVGIPDARKAFGKAVEAGADPDELIAAAGRYARHCQRTRKERQHIKHASGWLNGERWRDEIEDDTATTGTASNQPPPYGQSPIATCRWCENGLYQRTSDGRMTRCQHPDQPPADHPAAEPARSPR